MKLFKGKGDLHSFEKSLEREKKQFKELEKEGAKKVLKWYDFGMISLRREIKSHPAQYFFLFLTSFLGSVITSAFGLYGFSVNLNSKLSPPVLGATSSAKIQQVQKEDSVLIAKFDASLLLSKIKAKDSSYALIDVRSKKDFQNGHIEGAINIPVYGTSLVLKNGDLDKEGIAKAFKSLKNVDLVIIYAQNEYDSVPQAISQVLSDKNLTIKPLNVGWSEWSKAYIK